MMFAVLPSKLGQAARKMRAGLGALAFNNPDFTQAPAAIEVGSPAFGGNEIIPERFTEDGAAISPPLFWRNVPDGTRMLALLVEDADAPTPRPLVHALATDLPPHDAAMDEAFLPSRAERRRPGMGRNSYFQRSYLPMDALPGHGRHHYAFQIFALDYEPSFHQPPGRSALLRAMRGHVIARGMLLGYYERP